MRLAATLGAFGLRRAAVLLAGVLWAAFWAWAFSFAYSDSFFLWNRHVRWTGFAVIWLASLALPGSALYQWLAHRSRNRSVASALARHVVASLAVFATVAVVFRGLRRAPDPWHLEADDAMGFGIDFLALVAIGVSATFVLAVALAVARRRGRG